MPPWQRRANLDGRETPIYGCSRKRELRPNALLTSHRQGIGVALIADPADGELVCSGLDIGEREVTARIGHPDSAGGHEINSSFAQRSRGVAVQHRSGDGARQRGVGGNAGFCLCRRTRWLAMSCVTPGACDHGEETQQETDPRALR
jgi:hypothetical protein